MGNILFRIAIFFSLNILLKQMYPSWPNPYLTCLKCLFKSNILLCFLNLLTFLLRKKIDSLISTINNLQYCRKILITIIKKMELQNQTPSRCTISLWKDLNLNACLFFSLLPCNYNFMGSRNNTQIKISHFTRNKKTKWPITSLKLPHY